MIQLSKTEVKEILDSIKATKQLLRRVQINLADGYILNEVDNVRLSLTFLEPTIKRMEQILNSANKEDK